jgi:glutathione synthase/RimK-type ligase-like ATP-grasp enzyme
MKQCAFLTLEERGDFVIDDERAIEPLAALGWQVSVVSWRQTDIPWKEFDAVIIRSTWDYWDDVEGFMAALARIDQATRLANPLALVRWNLAKTYLRDLERNGVIIVPTVWPKSLEQGSLRKFCDQLDSDEIVIKPVVGANGVDTFRLSRQTSPADLEKIIPLFANRPFMAQRFMPAILAEGEYSLFFFNGDFSHAILKVPAQGEFRSQEERGAEIHPVVPETRLLQVAEAALATIEKPLYARIDLVRQGDGGFAIMECELIEPSLYLRTDRRWRALRRRWMSGSE